MEVWEQDTITTEEALVVVAIDDYKNRIITGNEICRNDIFLLIDGQKAGVIKEDGYHIFLDLEPGLHNLSVGGWMFQQQDIIIDAQEEKEIGRGIMKIRLQPGSHYMAGREITVLQGTAEPCQELHFVFINPIEPYRLYRNYRMGETEISIFHQSISYLDGKLFCLQQTGGQVEEFWVEEGYDENGRYRMRYPVNGYYDKGNSILRRVYVVTADHNGEFYLCVPAEEEDSQEYRYYSPLNKNEVQTGSFLKGKRNLVENPADQERKEKKSWECAYVEVPC